MWIASFPVMYLPPGNGILHVVPYLLQLLIDRRKMEFRC